MFQQVFFLFIFSIITLTAQSATNLRADSYFISFNMGMGEIQFQPFDKYLLIHSDISIPVKYEDSAPFEINQVWAPDGRWGQPVELTDANYQYGKTGSWAGITLVEADFNGDNYEEFMLGDGSNYNEQGSDDDEFN